MNGINYTATIYRRGTAHSSVYVYKCVALGQKGCLALDLLSKDIVQRTNHGRLKEYGGVTQVQLVVASLLSTRWWAIFGVQQSVEPYNGHGRFKAPTVGS